MLDDLADVLLPQRCLACGRGATGICDECHDSLPSLRPPLCRRCGAPVAWPVERCRECAGRRLAFTSARAAVAYEGHAIAFVSAWKDGGRRGLCRLAAQLVADAVGQPAVDGIAHVPAVRDRGLWRGHDPAEQLARALARTWRLPFSPLLARAASPRRQRGLTARERARNVDGAFAARARPPARVVLVDDVYTTGSTLSAGARALRRAGASEVHAVTFARTLRSRGPPGCRPGGLGYDGTVPVTGLARRMWEREEQGGSG